MATECQKKTQPTEQKVARRKRGRPPKVNPDGPQEIRIPPIDLQLLKVKVRGLSSLIVSRFSEKSQDEIERKQQHAAKRPRKARNPQAEFQASRHRISARKDGFPASGFKSAMIRACGDHVGLTTMVRARGLFFVVPDTNDLVALDAPIPRMHVAYVRRQQEAAIAYRAEYPKWSCTLTIRYDASAVSAEQLVGLLNHAGLKVGIGEWRPTGRASSGDHGMFTVAS
jgi:hypothetical protein